MKRINHTIKSEPVKIITNDCPLGVFRIGGYNFHDRRLTNCKDCNFRLADSPDKCAYDLYETPLIGNDSYTEEDDGTGALPSTDYTWNFKCAGCGKKITFYSGFSHLSSGDYHECRECKTFHRLIGNTDDVYSFAIPTSIKED